MIAKNASAKHADFDLPRSSVSNATHGLIPKGRWTFRLIVVFSDLSLVGMILIDRARGPRADFLNALSIVERLLGRALAASQSMVAAPVRALGELMVVAAANVVVGIVLALAVRFVARLLK